MSYNMTTFEVQIFTLFSVTSITSGYMVEKTTTDHFWLYTFFKKIWLYRKFDGAQVYTASF